MQDDYSELMKLEEDTALQQCLDRIDNKITTLSGSLEREAGGLPRPVERGLRESMLTCIKDLQSVRPNPYFGRVDFLVDGAEKEPQKYYIGKKHIDINYVYSWEAPVASLYYRDSKAVNGYEVRGQHIPGVVTLKRNITIGNSQLLSVSEHYRLRPPDREQLEVKFRDALLERLEQPRGATLEDIVSTIQPAQYEQIATTAKKALIIQGVAGSGKSEVGLHRIAYLLSPHNELGLNIVPGRVMFIGPSRLFLRYVSNILPGLNVERVRQTTIQEWIHSVLSHPVRLRQRDWLGERILTLTKASLATDLRVTKFKTSTEMAKLLNRYVESRLKSLIQAIPDVRIGNKVILKGSTARQYIRSHRDLPLNELRRQLIGYMSSQISQHTENRTSRSNIATTTAMVDRFWPSIDFHHAFVDLITNPEELSRLSRGVISKDEAERFSSGVSSDNYSCDTADLPALSYLDHLLDPRRSSGFQHIVVDEGQNVTPLEYHLLRLHSSNDSFTILGDLAQSVIPHRGVTSWSEISRLFAKEDVQRMNVTTSYRSTNEITRYRNRILGYVDSRAQKAVSIGRHGERPRFMRSRTYKDMVNAIAADITSLTKQGVVTIAVLCKTERESKKLAQELTQHGLVVCLLDEDLETEEPILVASIRQVKGLEFDAVLLSNARDYNFPHAWAYDRLLYLAITRAVHRLHIHWFGELAQILVPSRRYLKTPRPTTINSTG